jgi:hypothetical protein
MNDETSPTKCPAQDFARQQEQQSAHPCTIEPASPGGAESVKRSVGSFDDQNAQHGASPYQLNAQELDELPPGVAPAGTAAGVGRSCRGRYRRPGCSWLSLTIRRNRSSRVVVGCCTLSTSPPWRRITSARSRFSSSVRRTPRAPQFNQFGNLQQLIYPPQLFQLPLIKDGDAVATSCTSSKR